MTTTRGNVLRINNGGGAGSRFHAGRLKGSGCPASLGLGIHSLISPFVLHQPDVLYLDENKAKIMIDYNISVKV